MEENKNYVLEIEDLYVEYDTEDALVKAVNGFSLKLEHGHTVGLVGETGAGKTTTALSILGLVPNPPGVIKSGKILVEGNDIRSLSEEELGDDPRKRCSNDLPGSNDRIEPGVYGR